MAINRLDQNKDGADKAEKSQASAPLAPSNGGGSVGGAGGGGLKAWMPLLVTLIVMPAVAYAITTMVLLPKLQSSLGLNTSPTHGSGKDGKSAKEADAKKETAPMTKIMVNVYGSMASRFLLASFTLVGSGTDFKQKIERNDAQLRDSAGSVLATKSLADLEKPGARNLIRSELISAFNTVLGAGIVQEIYITEFAVQ